MIGRGAPRRKAPGPPGASTPAAERARRAASLRRALETLISDGGLPRAAFARRCGFSRSTLSQLLSARDDRLPSAESLCRVAETFGVSVDWLLGLADRPDSGLSVDARSSTIAAGLGPADSPLLKWHWDARGGKVRVVPSNLPDILKTDAAIRHEHALDDFSDEGPERAAARWRLDMQRMPEAEMECCTPEDAAEDLALGRGLWRGMPARERRAALLRMAEIHEELYPSFRWFMFDSRRLFVAPMTIFGRGRAALYVGESFLSLTRPEHVRHFVARFDAAVRRASVQPPDAPARLRALAARVP